MDSKDISAACAALQDEFVLRTQDLSYEKHGIFFSEMLSFCAVATRLGVSQFIESGRGNGQSTAVLAKFGSVVSIDIIPTPFADKRLLNMQNVTSMVGDANKLVPQTLRTDGRIGVLIDGPKGKDAVRLAKSIVAMSVMIGVHDCSRNDPTRALLEETFKYVWFSDDLCFVEAFAKLDDRCWKVYKRPYRYKDKASGSYGPTMALIRGSVL